MSEALPPGTATSIVDSEGRAVGTVDVTLMAGSPALPNSGPDAATFLGILRRRDFLLLWLAQVTGQLADKFLMFTLLVVVFSLTGRSSTQSLVLLAYTLPSILLSAAAGVYADRHDKRTIMVGTSAARGVLVGVIPLMLATPRLGSTAIPLVLATAVFSSVGQFFAPAEAASIPHLVRRDQIMLATSLFMTTVVGTLVAGVPLATLLIKVIGPDACFVVGAVLFLFASVCVLLIRTPLRAGPARPRATRSLTRELGEGLELLSRRPELRLGLGQLVVALVVVMTMFVLGPAYAVHILERGPADTYQLLLPSTAGIVVAAIALGRGGRRLPRSRAVWTAALLSGTLLIGTGYLPGFLVHHRGGELLTPTVIVFSSLFGAAIGALLIIAFTVVQEAADEQTRGRIFGAVFTAINAAVAIPLLVAGQLADTIGVDRVCVLLGAFLVGWAIFCRTRLWASVRLLDGVAA